MVALALIANQFEKGGAEGGTPKDAMFEMQTAVDKASAAGDEASSSQSSASTAGDCRLDTRAASVPERSRRKVSFGATEDIEEHHSDAPRLVPSLGEAPTSHDAGTTRNDSDLKVFCVHCGKQVPSKILTSGAKFCTYCGQRHPENLLDWTSRSQTAPCAAEAISMADSKSQMEMLQVPWSECQHGHTRAAEAAYANSGNHVEMQKVLWSLDQRWDAVPPLQSQFSCGQQGRLQRPIHNQRHHRGTWQKSNPACKEFSQRAS